jgi:hypothetical protein
VDFSFFLRRMEDKRKFPVPSLQARERERQMFKGTVSWDGIFFKGLNILTSSLVPASHWLQGKYARINLSQAAYGMILQNHRRILVSIFSVKIAALGSLKWVTGRIFKIVSNFKGASWFFHQLKNKKL